MDFAGGAIAREGFYAAHFFAVWGQEKARTFMCGFWAGKKKEHSTGCTKGGGHREAVTRLPSSGRRDAKRQRPATGRRKKEDCRAEARRYIVG
jgi:hypothetical protein